MPLQAQVVIEPFKKWALDFVGTINPASKKKKYILVCIDYVGHYNCLINFKQPSET
jgi:hypothetical protein